VSVRAPAQISRHGGDATTHESRLRGADRHGLVRLADTAESLAEEGRGLALDQACADVREWQSLSRYGTRGKCVWCELASAYVA
jgi:hypothetical protein